MCLLAQTKVEELFALQSKAGSTVLNDNLQFGCKVISDLLQKLLMAVNELFCLIVPVSIECFFVTDKLLVPLHL